MSLDTETGATELSDTTGPLAITEAAMETVVGIRDSEEEGDALLLRIEITGTRGREFVYDLSFATREEVGTGHHVYRLEGLGIAIEDDSVERLTGAELDVPSNSSQGGLVIRNPNTPKLFEGADLELTGELPEKVSQLLEERINPMLATHGGFAQLIGVDDDKNVYVNMGGGCQGCAASALTLRAGIRQSIMDEIPEVSDVIDATDHDSGENPFYS
ncbi:MAG: NifU family protein [Microthrixaceae bacterium]|nr:NifU family protein [Microthrixaceae bacterium]